VGVLRSDVEDPVQNAQRFGRVAALNAAVGKPQAGLDIERVRLAACRRSTGCRPIRRAPGTQACLCDTLKNLPRVLEATRLEQVLPFLIQLPQRLERQPRLLHCSSRLPRRQSLSYIPSVEYHNREHDVNPMLERSSSKQLLVLRVSRFSSFVWCLDMVRGGLYNGRCRKQ